MPASEPVLEPVTKKPSRWLTRVAPLAVGALLVGAGGVFGIKALQGDGGSPEAPVQKLFVALDHEDVVGMLESLTPGERDALVDPAQRLAGELRRVGVAGDSFDLAHLKGVDFQVKDLQLSSAPINDRLAEVRITGGTLTTSVSPDSLPLGNALRDALNQTGDSASSQATTHTAELKTDKSPLIVVKKDGQWGLSLGYTLAEAIRLDAGLERPDFAHPAVTPHGADTPEGAVRDMIGELGKGDVRGVISHLDPAEMAPLYDYSSLFLPSVDANDGLKSFAKTVTISDLKLSATGSGATRQVKVDGFRVRYQEGSQSLDAKLAGGCLTGSVNHSSSSNKQQQTFDSCAADGSVLKGSSTSAQNPLSQLGDFFDPSALSKRTGIAVHQVDGAWYVSPTRTVFDLVIAVVSTVKDNAVGDLVQQFSSALGGH